MARFDSAELVFKSDPSGLSKIIGLPDAMPDAWKEQDLPAMLRHQLSAPLKCDLSSMRGKGAALRIRQDILAQAESSTICTLLELFQHSGPPLALLKLTKDFFKAQAGPSDNRRQEQQVAYLIYLLSILVARMRLSTSITKLTDSQLLRGIKWAVEQSWVDGTTKALFTDGKEKLQKSA